MKPVTFPIQLNTYVFDKRKHLVKVYSDDMPDLHAEDIIGLADNTENPEFGLTDLSHLKQAYSLTEENLFARLRKNCYHSFVAFDEYINQKKGEFDFYQLPMFAQIGIIIEFLTNSIPPRLFLDYVDWKRKDEIVKRIIAAFASRHVEIYNENVCH